MRGDVASLGKSPESISESRKFFGDIAWVALSQVFTSFLGIITLPALTKTYTTADFGIWAQVSATVSLAVPLLTLQFGSTVVRFLAGESDKNKRRRSLGTMLGAILIFTCLTLTAAAEHHLRYHRRNRARGRMAGQVRIRARYENAATPWFDYLFVSADEMRAILKNTGWRIRRILKTGGPTYYAIIGKEARKIE